MDCASCRSDFYKNTTEDSCKICPNNCSSCEQAPDIWKVNCKECKQLNMTVDWTEKRCRPKCSNPTHFFDYKDYSCKPCPASTMINNDTKVCEKCPKGCTGCYKNSTSNVTECNKCDFGLVLDSGKRLCRPTCASWKTYYFETETCRECPPYQTYSYATKNCTSCDFGCINCFSQMSNKTKPSCIDCGNGTLFDYKTWQCKIPCNSSRIFNYDTKTCEKCPLG
jgi:proprotein convertase subtilisin/kexin type 5